MHKNKQHDGQTQVSAILLILILLLSVGGFLFLQFQRKQVAYQGVLQAEAQALATTEQSDSVTENIARQQNSIDQQALENAIRQVLQTQQQHWSNGDIDQFMGYYWKSDDLTFSSGGKVTRSWQATLDNYKQRYSSDKEMGHLYFDNLEITPLGPEAAFVLGEWHLTRDVGNIGGNFTLIFRNIDNRWVIVHDHTSQNEESR